MNADDYRRKAQHFLTLARQMSLPADRTVLIAMAAFWLERAEEAERDKRTVQQQPEKEPEREGS